jgi:hypothetical protein
MMSGLDVLVGFAVDQLAHRFVRDVVHLGKLTDADIQFGKLLAQCACLLVRKTCEAMSLALRPVLAFLCKHISNIFPLGAYEEMRNSDASASVTMVTNQQIVRYGAVGQSVGEAMSKYALAVGIEFPVTVVLNIPSPYPAPITFGDHNLTPKALFDWSPSAIHSVLMGMNKFVRLVTPNKCLTAATAMAVTVWNFVKGKLGLDQLWGMLHGIGSPFTTIGQTRGAHEASPGLFIGFYRSSITHIGIFG